MQSAFVRKTENGACHLVVTYMQRCVVHQPFGDSELYAVFAASVSCPVESRTWFASPSRWCAMGYGGCNASDLVSASSLRIFWKTSLKGWNPSICPLMPGTLPGLNLRGNAPTLPRRQEKLVSRCQSWNCKLTKQWMEMSQGDLGFGDSLCLVLVCIPRTIPRRPQPIFQ